MVDVCAPVVGASLLLALLQTPTNATSSTEATPDSASVILADASLALPSVVAPVLEVRGRRITPQDLVDRAPGFGSILLASDWTSDSTSAADVLSRAVGLTVRESGGFGSYSTLSIRGSTSAQVPVFFDGVPLNSPGRGEVNLADISLGSLDRIEIYRGAAPLDRGGVSAGGAIHLYSARDAAAWIRMGAGSYNTRTLEGGGGTSAGAWRFSARAHWRESQGDWEFFDDNGTRYNLNDDARVERVNNDGTAAGTFVSAQRPAGAWNITLSEAFDQREQGMPGFSAAQSERARTSSLTHQFRVALRRPLSAASRWREVSLFHRIDRQGFLDPDGDLGLGRNDRTDTVHGLGLVAAGSLTPARANAWRTEFHWSRLNSTDRLQSPDQGEPQTRATWAASLQPSLHWEFAKVTARPGLRAEVHYDRFHGTLPFASLPTGPRESATTWAPAAQFSLQRRLSPNTFVESNFAYTHRVPTLLESFGDRGTVIGNPDLQPETSVNRDLGIVWTPAAGRRFALAMFQNDAWDLISFQSVNGMSARAFNVGRAEIEGIEVEMNMGRMGAMHMNANFTAMSARDRTDRAVAGGHPLVGRPGYELQVRMGATVRRVLLEYELVAMGQNYLETGRRTPIDPRTLHSLRSHIDLGRAQLDINVQNLADREVFDLLGHPLPGRTLRISLGLGGQRALR